MLSRLRKYCQYIYEDSTTPWPDGRDPEDLADNIWGLHDRAHGIMAFVYPDIFIELFDKSRNVMFNPQQGIDSYPEDFVSNPFIPQYQTHIVLVKNNELHTEKGILAIALDVYFMTGKLLHILANHGTVNAAQIIEIRNICALFKDVISEKCNRQNRTIKEAKSNLYIQLLQSCHFFNAKNPLPFKTFYDLISKKYTASKPYTSDTSKIYFEGDKCIIKKEQNKKESTRTISLRTFENIYTQGKKISQNQLL